MIMLYIRSKTRDRVGKRCSGRQTKTTPDKTKNNLVFFWKGEKGLYSLDSKKEVGEESNEKGASRMIVVAYLYRHERGGLRGGIRLGKRGEV